MVGGRIVYAADDFKSFDLMLPPAMPGWSPVRKYNGYHKSSKFELRRLEELHRQALAFHVVAARGAVYTGTRMAARVGLHRTAATYCAV